MITAPFNFVPLNKDVFFPPWAEQVNHDIPFEDGECGEIEITITAESPIFIRNHKADTSSNDKYYTQNKKNISTEFCNHNGKFYIPGSSVKGMVRNVLEIMSFSKLNFVDDKTYAVRDLKNPELYTQYFTPDNIYCGWLQKNGDNYMILDCGIPGRIHHNDIDSINFAPYFKPSKFKPRIREQKTAEYKYELYTGILEDTFNYVGQDYGRNIYERGGDKKGTLVFTGQASARRNTGQARDGKGYEFIFFEIQENHLIDDEVFENFKFAYFDGRKTQPKESEDWKFWKKKLYNGEKIPVFFRKTDNGEIRDFGLSYLYKLPYEHSVKDGIYVSHHDICDRPDLSQTIFGYIGNNEDKTLKGRVQFSHFKAIGIQHSNILPKKTVILGTPRASYYPIYVKQTNGQLYSTFMDSDFVIAGRKRYPIHRDLPNHANIEQNNMTTSFKPLNKGVEFKGKLRYHNLKKAEIGALLSALTFHNKPECYHNIGLAKSLGYGKVTIELTDIRSVHNINGEPSLCLGNITDYLKAFEYEISKQIANWASSDELKELFSMSIDQNNSQMSYMSLQEFANNKTTGIIATNNYLQNYTSLYNIRTMQPVSLLTSNEKATLDKERTNILNQLKQDMEEKDRECVKKIKKIDLLKLYKQKYRNSIHLEEIDEMIREIENNHQKEKEEKDWVLVQESDNISVVENFKEKYSDSLYIEQIDGLIEKIKEKKEKEKIQKDIDDAWNSIKESEDISKLEVFVKKYSNSKYIKQAETKIKELKDKEKKRIEQEKKTKSIVDEKKAERKKIGAYFRQKINNKKKKGKK